MPKAKISAWHNFLRSVWLFPVLLAAPLLLMTGLKISGSSIGIYHDIFYGKTDDPNLLFNHPQAIRSDEWIVTTQLTIAQNAAGYPRFNPNIDAGRDMTVVGDAPAKDWSTAFRPQNLSFIILPLEYAFAFKWWLLLYLTIISCYFFTLRFFRDRRLFAAIFSVAIGCSPFLFWWYQTGTLAPIFYAFFILLLAMRIINGDKIPLLAKRPLGWSQAVHVAGLTYLMMAFALVLYPPFQIPVAVVIFIFALGLFLNSYAGKLFSKQSLKKLGLFSIAMVLAGILALTFVKTRANVIDAISNTVYPGHRSVQDEGNSVYEISSTYLQPQLQRSGRAQNYYTNQSEASNFILLLPFLFLPGFLLLIAEYRQTRKINWPLLGIQAAITLLLAHLFVPQLAPLWRVTGLDKVANVRSFIGLGLAGAIQLLLVMKSIENLKIPKPKLSLMAAGYSLVVFGTLLGIGKYTIDRWPIFLHNWLFVGGLAGLFCLILFFALSRRPMLAVITLLVFTLGSVWHIHPLYRGLGPVYRSEISKTMNQLSPHGESWGTMDMLLFENFAVMAGEDSLNGVKPYPDVAFWRQVEGPSGDYIYNRYAHSLLADNADLSEPLKLTQPDAFIIKFACTPFIESHVTYTLSIHKIEQPCVSLIKQINYPALTFYVYKVNR